MDTPTKEPKTKKKIDTAALLNPGESLDDAALRLTKVVGDFDSQIDDLTKKRTKIKTDLRHIESKIVTRNLREKAA